MQNFWWKHLLGIVSFYSSAHCLNRWLYGWSNVWSNNSCNSSSLPALALCKFSICISLYTQCPVIANTLQIWFQFRHCFCFKGYSICNNHLFYWWCFCPFLNSLLWIQPAKITLVYIFSSSSSNSKPLDVKSSKPPLVSLWLSNMMLFLQLEKIKYSLRWPTKRFYSVWTPMITYFEKGIRCCFLLCGVGWGYVMCHSVLPSIKIWIKKKLL